MSRNVTTHLAVFFEVWRKRHMVQNLFVYNK